MKIQGDAARLNGDRAAGLCHRDSEEQVPVWETRRTVSFTRRIRIQVSRTQKLRHRERVTRSRVQIGSARIWAERIAQGYPGATRQATDVGPRSGPHLILEARTAWRIPRLSTYQPVFPWILEEEQPLVAAK